jgi:hypothetical protein
MPGIFRRASEELPDSVSSAFFDKPQIQIEDEFEGIIKEASSVKNRTVYENRLKEFKKAQDKTVEFEKPEPAKYAQYEGGIRRVGFGPKFQDENSPMFGQESLRSTVYDNTRTAEVKELSIWEPEFDQLEAAFKQSQDADSARFNRKIAQEKKDTAHLAWEYQQLKSLRKSNVLPYRGLGITRTGNEQPLNHGKINSVNEYLAQTNDQIRELTRTANRERKSGITRQGVDPEERRSQWENKEAIEARTISALQNNSEFLRKFADGFSLEDE